MADDFMDEWEKELEENRSKLEEERLAFLDKCLSKLTDPNLAYRCLALRLGERFEISSDYSNEFPDAVYSVLNYWVDEVDEDFETWINKDDAPFIRKAEELNKIFPEFSFETSLRKKVELINKVYGLELMLSENCWGKKYVYAYSFDFNSFTPINVKKIHELKNEIEVLKKHNADTTSLEEELKEFNLPSDVLEVI